MHSALLTRKLTSLDFSKAVELIRSRNTFVGVPPERLGEHRAMSEMVLKSQLTSTQSIGSVIGLEQSGELIGMACTSISQYQPCWFLSKIHTREDQDIATITQLFDAAVSFHEEMKLFRFYTLSSANHLRAYGRILSKSSIHQSYFVYTDLLVDENSKTNYMEYWDHLYNRLPCAHRTAVRGFVKRGNE